MSEKSPSKKPRVLSLFSGGGGLDLGFHLAGFNIRVSSDIVPLFLKTVELNKGRYFAEDHRLVCTDASQAAPSDFGDKTFDFLIGGPPCQSFSAAGRRTGGVRGINDFRGSLFWHYCRLIEHFQPQGFLFENVRGLLQANQGRDWSRILETFKTLGYNIFFRVLDAADYGIPQHRERLIAVGLKENDFLFPQPTHGPLSHDQKPYVTAGQALSDLDDPNENIPPYQGKWGDLLMEVPPGMNYLHFTEEMGHKNPRFAWRSRFSDFLYKLDPDLPSKTIVAMQGKYGGPFHWRSRKLSIAEYKRLQSFPDDYEFSGPPLAVIQQIGNSVAPRFGEILGRAILKQAFGVTESSIDLLPHDQVLPIDRRKREKAARTKKARTLLPTTEPGQLPLWNEETAKPRPTENQEFRWIYSEPRERQEALEWEEGKCFRITAAFESNIWVISVQECTKEAVASMTLKLTFFPSSDRGFDAIHVELKCSSLEYSAVAWDAVDWCVRRCTSFSSIQPLYGHFAEPHPKFRLEVDAIDQNNKGIQDFLLCTSRFDYVSALRPMSELCKFFPDREALQIVRYLRSLGWDIRVHETNRTIPSGFFRSSYPFPVSFYEPRFVSWKEKGADHYADRTAIPPEIGEM